jgi:hypothetical protein
MKTEKQKLTLLTWKYFWKQKLIEFSWLIIIFLITIGYYKIIDYLNCKYPTLFYSAEDSGYNKITCHLFKYNIEYMILGLFGIAVILIILFIICLIIGGFISSNWKKAKLKAKKELRGKK